MIPDRLGMKTDGFIKIIHNFSIADEGRTLYSTLKLITGIKDKSIVRVFFFDNIDEVGHVLKATIGIILMIVLTLHQGRECSPMKIINGYDCDSRVLGNNYGDEDQKCEQSNQHEIFIVQVIQ